MPTSPLDSWKHCLSYIHSKLPEQTFETWFSALKFVDFKEGELVVGTPNRFVAEYIEEHHANLLGHAIQLAFGDGVHLTYHIAPQAVGPSGTAGPLPAAATPTAAWQGAQRQPSAPLNPFAEVQQPAPLDPNLTAEFTFENFVEGRSNKLARTIGLAIAGDPGKAAFNPLFLYGPSGVGKTHLANAVGMRIREQHPEMRTLFVPAHLFKTQYTDSVLHNTSNEFIHFYQTIDVLIIDDIQEITTAKTQQAFFHIFNHLSRLGKQILLTSDKAPAELTGIEERMLTRFKSGMVAELERPDSALRRAILKAKIRRDGLSFPKEVIDYIATYVTGSVRELQGIVNSIMAYSVVDNCDITLELAERVVARAVNLVKKELTAESILKTTCQHFNIKEKEVQGKSRKADIVQARQVSMFLCHKYTDLPLSGIGRIIGRRDHSTVAHSCNLIASRIATDKKFRLDMEELESKLKKA
ncbi:MAG: chromosomal replication initiator protein DnaA [Alloprevotella sp.]|nr:chromosomal replication initiator protein DnaA [Alloprevotella sp.]